MSMHTHDLPARPRHPPRSSFTLVEVLAAVVLLTLISAGLTSLIQTLRSTRVLLNTLPELDQQRWALVHALRDPTGTDGPFQAFESTFLASAEHPLPNLTHSYVWLVRSRDGVSAAVLVPQHPTEFTNRDRGATSHRSEP